MTVTAQKQMEYEGMISAFGRDLAGEIVTRQAALEGRSIRTKAGSDDLLSRVKKLESAMASLVALLRKRGWAGLQPQVGEDFVDNPTPPPGQPKQSQQKAYDAGPLDWLDNLIEGKGSATLKVADDEDDNSEFWLDAFIGPLNQMG
jgi:hypothetical protein